MAAEGHPIKLGCRLLHVSESGFYAQRSRPPSVRSLECHRALPNLRRMHLSTGRARLILRPIGAQCHPSDTHEGSP